MRNGDSESYQYGYINDNKQHYFTEVTKVNKSERYGRPNKVRKEWKLVRQEDGSTQNTQLTTVANGMRIQKHFDDHGVVSKIVNHSLTTNTQSTVFYTFDELGRVSDQKGENWQKKRTYVDRKSERLQRLHINTVKEQFEYVYEYSGEKLSSAIHENRKIIFNYRDSDSEKISKIILDKTELGFLYDKDNRINQIVLDSNETINLICDLEDKCNFKEASSTSKRKISSVLLGVLYMLKPTELALDLATGTLR